MRQLRVIEDATLPDVLTGEDKVVAKAGQVVYEFTGPTYGCITPSGLACSAAPGVGPFFEVALSNLVPAEEDAVAGEET
jgi:hypothetical protein